MNYYIQGCAANAERIKAAFEAKAIHNGCNLNFTKEDRLFYSCDGKVNYCSNSGGLANIIKTHPDYQELELPVNPSFKVGDWIASIDGEGDVTVERIVNLRGNKVLLVDTDGCFVEYPKGELESCHLWSIADAKDGDVLVTTNVRSCPFIYRKTSYKNNLAYYYVGINGNGDLTDAYPKNTLCHFGLVSDVVPATKEQRDLLFAKMKEAGYKWDEEKKELHKIHPHYDIANFKPFDKVLVRCSNDEEWMIEFYCKYDTLVHTAPHRDYPFMGIGDSYSQCIPFNEETKHLLGTTDPCDEQYINW